MVKAFKNCDLYVARQLKNVSKTRNCVLFIRIFGVLVIAGMVSLFYLGFADTYYFV